jgi:hypothetical protein
MAPVTRSWGRTLPFLVLPLLLGCAPAAQKPPAVQPTSGVTDAMPSRDDALYPIPRGAPRGNVRLASYGVVEVARADESAQKSRAVHLRIIVTNEDDRAWTLDARDQRLELDGHGAAAPAFASASGGGSPPVVVVPQSAILTADLFFLVPIELQSAASLPAFDASVQVDTGREIAAARAPFQALPAEPLDYETYDYGAGYYWGPPYWQDPHVAGAPISVRQSSSHFVARHR